jgi:hypothetical protein
MKSIQKTVFKVSDFLSWQRIGSLLLSPAFQRRPVWPAATRSLLIDTVVKGIPVPIIFLRERTDLRTLEPQREVVDGQQRLRTLISFIEPTALKDYEESRDAFVVRKSHNAEIAGKAFRQLPDPIKRTILDYEFSVHVLPSNTDDRQVLQIFARMNSTGYKLNGQELRNAAWYGTFKRTAYDLAYEQLSRWRSWGVFSEIDIARMIEVEETSDMMVTVIQGLHGKRQKLLNDTYKKYDEEFPHADEVARRVRETMDRVEDSVGEDLRSLAFSRKSLFNTLFTFYYDLMYGLGSQLRSSRPARTGDEVAQAVRVASGRISSGDLPEDLSKILRGATGDLGSRRKRFEFLKRTLQRAEA